MIDQLLALMPPPPNPTAVATEEDWLLAEVALEFRFPPDLKLINAHYGEGWFGGFIYVMGPSPSARGPRIHEHSPDTETIFEYWPSFAPLTAPNPADHRLIPIAETTNGDEIFYLVNTITGSIEISVHASREAVGTRYAVSFRNCSPD
jgi:hypothetical protein